MSFTCWAFIDFIWLFLALAFAFSLCILKLSRANVNYSNSKILCIFEDLIRYGKTKNDLRRGAFLRGFSIFILFSVIWNSFLIRHHINAVFFGVPYPIWLSDLSNALTNFCVQHETASITIIYDVRVLSVLLIHLLLWVHSIRRLYECLFISVFSDGVIHIVQYCFGLAYYILLGLTVISTSSISQAGGSTENRYAQIHFSHFLGITMFIWASVHQNRCLTILANLRKENNGKVINMHHSIPVGDWFSLISSPHYFAELLIYISLSLTLGGWNLTWWLVVLYVLFNQALAAALCQEFYHKKFDSYPNVAVLLYHICYSLTKNKV
uniref:Polyprenal reductase n=1 Tax=Erpetoichthys calabaricus TaxID=27687 RepID=A0A8C4SKG1_ERPCA